MQTFGVPPKIALKFDGSNGPTHVWTCIGWAYLIEFENGLALRNFGHRFTEKSNVTVAEFEGLLHGLKRIRGLRRLHANLSTRRQIAESIPSILIQGDSQTVIELLKQGDPSKVSRNLRPLHDAAFKLLEEIGISWNAERIPERRNSECDGLAHAELEACLRESTQSSS
jgi:ribonuclease HI